MNRSRSIRQPTLAAGNSPHLLSFPKRVDPSRRNDADNRYLESKLYCMRAKNEMSLFEDFELDIEAFPSAR